MALLFDAQLATLDRLFALETFGIKLGLDNISHLCEGLGHPERSFRSLHVAGTNGKGSVTAMVHAILRAAGIRAARYTSPHLSDLAERFVIGDEQVDAGLLLSAVDDVLRCADRLREAGVLTVPPTFFEASTAAAFEMFRRERVDVGVIEVGLGGRFDATNVITPLAGAITSIHYDHQQHLGDTLAAIAFEKAGIIKPEMTVVIGALAAEAGHVIRRCAVERGAAVVDARADSQVAFEMIDGRACMRLSTPLRSYGPVVLGLRGEHQIGNALVAVRLAETAGIAVPPDAVERGLATADWPARLELLSIDGNRRVLLDAAHNPEGACALAAYLNRWHPERPPLVIGVMKDKSVAGIARAMLPAVSSIVATEAPTPRAIPAAELARQLRAAGALDVHIQADPHVAIEQALATAETICIAGSIFLVGAVRERLRQRQGQGGQSRA